MKLKIFSAVQIKAWSIKAWSDRSLGIGGSSGTVRDSGAREKVEPWRRETEREFETLKYSNEFGERENVELTVVWICLSEFYILIDVARFGS